MDQLVNEPAQGSKNIWQIIAIAIIAILVIGGGIYWYYNSGSELKNEVSETTEWNTYKNEEHNFEMDYPKEWKKTKEFSDSVVFYGGKKLEDSKVYIRVQIEDKDDELNSEYYAKNWLDRMNENFNVSDNSQLEPKQINGKDFYFVKASFAGSTYYKYYTENENDVFVITMDSLLDNPTEENSYKYIFDQMLSTVKFVD